MFFYSGMNWLVRKLDVGDRNEPALKGQTAKNVNNVEESKDQILYENIYFWNSIYLI